ncbi:putative serine racemase, Ammonia-lyase [Helianthus annuus]|nr:putative serine racemase, Ammonia-lyase [Helianthus annuus]
MGGYKYATDIDSITKAQDVIKAHIHVTPVLSSASLNSIAGKSLYFKCECFQKRGALNAVLSLDEEEAAKGVVTHSR